MSERIRLSGGEVFRILREKVGYNEDDYVVLIAKRISKSPFLLLVSIILSQNTNDKNSIRALRRFIEMVGENCEEVTARNIRDIMEAIKPAGLYIQKARSIIELASRICEVGEEYLLEAPIDELRRFLSSIEGVGPKTIDVFLSVARGEPVFAVDTHARRIAIRWGLVEDNASYNDVSRALLEFFGGDKAEESHRLLISLGRKYCRSKNPRCSKCPLRQACPYARRLLQSQSLGERHGASRNYQT